VSLHDLFEKYHEKIQFLTIYIREAHPVDGWWFGGGITGLMMKIAGSKAALDVYQHKNIDERRAIARRCESTLKYGIKTYVDEMDDAVNKAYAGWPTRLYLIGKDGRIVHAGGLGPFGFKTAELEKAIEEHLDLENSSPESDLQ
jgi:hypothetical protein